MKLVWTKLAQNEGETIRDTIATDNPGAALDFDELLSKKAARLPDVYGQGVASRR